MYQKEKAECEKLRTSLMKTKEQLRDSRNEAQALQEKCAAGVACAASAEEERMQVDAALAVGG